MRPGHNIKTILLTIVQARGKTLLPATNTSHKRSQFCSISQSIGFHTGKGTFRRRSGFEPYDSNPLKQILREMKLNSTIWLESRQKWWNAWRNFRENYMMVVKENSQVLPCTTKFELTIHRNAPSPCRWITQQTQNHKELCHRIGPGTAPNPYFTPRSRADLSR